LLRRLFSRLYEKLPLRFEAPTIATDTGRSNRAIDRFELVIWVS
jgi:hypothetical protein